MKKILCVVLVGLACLSFMAYGTGELAQDEIPYPEGYRNWTHVKTKLAGPGNPNFSTNGGFHHIYANSIAVKGYATGHFQDGAVLIFDVIDIKEQGGNTMEAGRKRVDVMVKDSLKYPGTGGWGFAEFNGDSHIQVLTPIMQRNCFSCHAQRENAVFSHFRN